MEQVEHTISKASTLSAWNPERNTSLAIHGHAIPLLLSKAATLFYLSAPMQWLVHPMECFVTQFLQRPGITPGSTIRWWAKVASSRPLRAVGTFRQFLSPLTRLPAAR